MVCDVGVIVFAQCFDDFGAVLVECSPKFTGDFKVHDKVIKFVGIFFIDVCLKALDKFSPTIIPFIAFEVNTNFFVKDMAECSMMKYSNGCGNWERMIVVCWIASKIGEGRCK